MEGIKIGFQKIAKGVSQEEKIIPFSATEVTIGRSPENDITITDKLASRLHARIAINIKDENTQKTETQENKSNAEETKNSQDSTDLTFFIEDANSTHGTYIGKTKLEKGGSHAIASGMMISFGQPNSFYFVKFYDQFYKEIVSLNVKENETNTETPNEPKTEKNTQISEKKYLDEYQQSQKDRSRLDIYKELLNKEKGYKFAVEGNKTLGKIKQKSKTYKSQFDKPKKKEENWEISWGIVDEKAINKKGFDDLVLDPVLLRKIPGLKIKEQNKINEFEVKLRKYKRLMKEYNEFVSKLNKAKKNQSQASLNSQR